MHPVRHRSPVPKELRVHEGIDRELVRQGIKGGGQRGPSLGTWHLCSPKDSESLPTESAQIC